MKYLKYLLMAIFIILAFAPAWMSAYIFAGHTIGYYPGGVGWEIAKIAAEKKDPSVCERIIGVPWSNLGPPIQEQKDLCYYDLAKIIKDPYICRKLMPSDYAKSCLSNYGSDLNKRVCTALMYEEGIYCLGKKVSESAQIENCLLYKEVNLRDWCYFSRSAMLPSIDDCSHISQSPPELLWECQQHLARKEKDPTLCNQISDQKWKDLCELWIEADKSTD